jgi:hypothetical protein
VNPHATTILAGLLVPLLLGSQAAPLDPNYLLWTMTQAEKVGLSTRATVRVGTTPIRVTWLTPEVIRATARLAQISDGINVEATDGLVQEAEYAAGTVVLLELGADQPSDVTALLQPKGLSADAVKGTLSPELGELRALRGVAAPAAGAKLHWVAFPRRDDGAPLFPATAREAELVVRVRDREGRVSWPVPESLRQP